MEPADVWISHLSYELTTLAELPRWVDHYVRPGPTAVHIACLEATMIHGRLLVEFLVGRDRRHPNDVQPSDFLPDWEHPDPSRLRRHLPMIDRHLAHLSKDRADGTTAPPGYLTELVDDVRAGMELFVQALTKAGSPHGPAFQSMVTIATIKRAQGPVTWPPEGWGG